MNQKENIWKNENLIRILGRGGVAVIPTDTLYGIVARAESKHAVERIYEIRKRLPTKPCIVLVGALGDLEKFSIKLSEEQKEAIEKLWSFASAQDPRPVPTSIVFDCPDEELNYLHRGTNTLAIRMPAPQALRNLLLEIGPLIAPSANPEGLPPATNITEAQKYFGDLVDIYVDGRELKGKASKLIKLHSDGSVTILRP